MTILAGRPAAGTAPDRPAEATAAVATRPADATTAASAGGGGDVPALVDGTDLLGCQPGSGYVCPPSLVRRVDGQVLQLTPLLYAVLAAVDGRRNVDEIAATAGAAVERHLTGDDVRTLVDGKLRPLGLVLGADGTHPPLRRANPLLALKPRLVVSKPEWTRRLTAPFAVLFHPAIVTVATVAFAAVAFWVLFVQGLAGAAHAAFTRPGLLLAVFAITIGSAGFHEFGHAAALRYGGGTPGAMGAGLYLIYPAFYTDVTDGYRLGRAARVRTDLGGLYFNALVALAMFGIWAATRWQGLLLVIAAQILQMIRQLPPLVRYDGYHLLADVTGVPDLFHRISPTLRSFLPRRWRPANARELKRWARVVVTAWVVLVVPLLLITALLTVVALPRILGTTAHSVSVQASQLAASSTWTAGAAKALAMVALVVPVGGILFMLVRVVRRYATRIWVRTRGKPVKRAVAVTAMLAVAAGVGYAWWPHGGTYRPIEPGERGTVQDGVQAAVAPHTPVAAATPLREGETRTASTLWPAAQAALPAPGHKVLAVVLVPRERGAGHPTWVFPFNRPDRPGPGDNQSLAVVTKDGGTAYDVAFALVTVDGDPALNTNSAYALASCTDCRAVAVSFQVVLVVGHADVAPQNLAAAVSYDCTRCVTHALATQLVLTVPDRLDHRTDRRLHRLWREIRRFGKHLRGLSLAEIRARLQDYEKQIVAVIRPDAVATSTATGTPSPSASASPSATTSPSATATPSATDSAAPAPAAAPSDTEATPTDTSSPSPSSSPSSSPSTSTSSSSSATPEDSTSPSASSASSP